MFCSFCGHKNEEGNKFCSECGRELGKTPPPNKESSGGPVDSSITRKSLKKDALNKKKAPLYLAYILQVIITVAVVIIFLVILGAILFQTATSVSTSSNEVQKLAILLVSSLGIGLLFSIIMQVITTLCNLGIFKIALDISRDQPSSLGNLFSYPIHNFSKLMKLLVVNIVFTLITTILQQIPIVGSLAYLVIIIYVTPVLAILPFMIIDDENTNILELIKQANNLVTKKRIAYYALIASFIGWYLLAIPTLGLILLWLVPYQTTALSNFYLSLKKEKVYNTEPSGLSDTSVVVISAIVGVVGIIIIVFAISFFLVSTTLSNASDNLKDNYHYDNYNDDYDYDDYYDNYDDYEEEILETQGEVTIGELSLYIPYDYYKSSITENAWERYWSEEYDAQISAEITEKSSATLRDYMTQDKNSNLDYFTTCSEIETKTINNHSWDTYHCEGTYLSGTYYAAEKENKIYYVYMEHDIYDETDTLEYNIALPLLENSLAITSRNSSV